MDRLLRMRITKIVVGLNFAGRLRTANIAKYNSALKFLLLRYLRSDSRCYSLIMEQPVMKVCLLHTPTYCQWKMIMVLNIFRRPSDLYIEKLNTTVSLNQYHIYGSQYPLKWREPQYSQVYRQLPQSMIEGMTQWVCEQVPPSNEGRRLDALDCWIGNRWECFASILSLLVVL